MKSALAIAAAILWSALAALGQSDFRVFGDGCDGGPGIAALTFAGRPKPGVVAAVFVEPVAPGQPAALFLGLSRQRDPLGPLPRALDPLRAPGCLQQVSFDIALATVTGFGRAAHLFPIPADPELIGAVFYTQHAHGAPTANQLGVALSDAARLGLGGPAWRLTAVAYNIRAGLGLDGRRDLGRTGDVLARLAADVIALQEVDQGVPRSGSVDQTAVLAARLGMRGVFGRSTTVQGGGYGNALLTRLPVLRHTVHPLPNPANREPRTVLDAELQLPDGRAFRVMSTHLDHGADPTTRRQSIDAILALVATSELPILLLGDLNAEPGSAEIARLGAVMDDASAATPLPTFPADVPTRRIDYAFTWPRLPFEIRGATVAVEPVASDHRPVVVTIDLH